VSEASIRDLRNHGGDVIDRVLAGERITITRDGKPVAELRPVRRPPLSPEALVARFKGLPPIDPGEFRADLDAVIDPWL
jgi:prevent-host-death family protein